LDINLQKHIFETFPWYSKDCKEKGILCGNGWYSILNELNFKIDEYLKKSKIKDFKIENISQFFGGLKININIENNVINRYIEEAVAESYLICEYCGNNGYPYNIQGWGITLCEDCLMNPPIKKIK
jgi:uncharacterized CHY-type Zn-finger protein